MSFALGQPLGTGNGARGILDVDCADYFTKANVTNATSQARLLSFADGIKSMGIWGGFVCWPLIKNQNTGTAPYCYSLGGLGKYDGLLQGSASLDWTTNGFSVAGTGRYIRTLAAVPDYSKFTMGVFYIVDSVNYQAGIGNSSALSASLCGWGSIDTPASISATNLTGSSISFGFPEASPLTVTGGSVADGQAVGIIGTKSGYLSTGYVYAGSSTPATNSLTTGTLPSNTGTPVFTLMNKSSTSNTAPRYTTQSFYFLINRPLSATEVATFYSLFKTTIGTQLNLP
jgi:hypothetical protein